GGEAYSQNASRSHHRLLVLRYGTETDSCFESSPSNGNSCFHQGGCSNEGCWRHKSRSSCGGRFGCCNSGNHGNQAPKRSFQTNLKAMLFRMLDCRKKHAKANNMNRPCVPRKVTT
ncbi:unnamed protein product, partial [Musa acuminata subsp. burmannicoides]